MSLRLDHAIIAVQDLEAAIQDYRDLGFTSKRGGIHANRATQNALITFQDETYLELLAPTGDQPIPGLVNFDVLLERNEGLVGFALRSHNLDFDADRLRVSGFTVSEVMPGERHREDGKLVQWKLALLDDGFTPFLIQDVSPREWRISHDPALTTHPNGARGLYGVEITVRNLNISLERYTNLFDATLFVSHNAEKIILHEAKIEQDEILHAILLDLDQPVGDQFISERTHGVCFKSLVSDDRSK